MKHPDDPDVSESRSRVSIVVSDSPNPESRELPSSHEVAVGFSSVTPMPRQPDHIDQQSEHVNLIRHSDQDTIIYQDRRIDLNNRSGLGNAATSLHSNTMINHPGVAVRNIMGTQDGFNPSTGLRYTSSPTLPNQQTARRILDLRKRVIMLCPLIPFKGLGTLFRVRHLLIACGKALSYLFW